MFFWWMNLLVKVFGIGNLIFIFGFWCNYFRYFCGWLMLKVNLIFLVCCGYVLLVLNVLIWLLIVGYGWFIWMIWLVCRVFFFGWLVRIRVFVGIFGCVVGMVFIVEWFLRVCCVLVYLVKLLVLLDFVLIFCLVWLFCLVLILLISVLLNYWSRFVFWLLFLILKGSLFFLISYFLIWLMSCYVKLFVVCFLEIMWKWLVSCLLNVWEKLLMYCCMYLSVWFVMLLVCCIWCFGMLLFCVMNVVIWFVVCWLVKILLFSVSGKKNCGCCNVFLRWLMKLWLLLILMCRLLWLIMYLFD